MSIEYGCATTNKFGFLDETEVEDPSDLLAQVTLTAAAAKSKDAAKGAAKDAKGKAVGGKTTVGGDKAKTGAAGAGGRKTPLQQTDNSVKPGSKPTDPGSSILVGVFTLVGRF